LQILNETFANRVWFVGLQGSYARGEACDTSDIDVARKMGYDVNINFGNPGNYVSRGFVSCKKKM